MSFNPYAPKSVRLNMIYYSHVADTMWKIRDLPMTSDRSEDLKASRPMPKTTSLTTML